MSDCKVTLLISKGQAAALADAAQSRHTTCNDYVRYALLNQLRADGFEPPAGFALVHNGELVRDDQYNPVSCGFDSKPEGFSSKYPAGSQWLPIVVTGAEPFNHATQYRLTPFLRVRGEYVERVYPIVRKEDDR